MVRVSDADRETAVVVLREHLAQGRLTLEEFSDRMSSAYGAVTRNELEQLTRDLPAAAPSGRRPTRYAVSIFGSTKRQGRLRISDRVTCFTLFGNVDLDLRQATLEGDAVGVAAFAVFGSVDVYVPEGVDVDLRGLAIFGSKRVRGADPVSKTRTALVDVSAFVLFGAVDVRRGRK